MKRKILLTVDEVVDREALVHQKLMYWKFHSVENRWSVHQAWHCDIWCPYC